LGHEAFKQRRKPHLRFLGQVGFIAAFSVNFRRVDVEDPPRLATTAFNTERITIPDADFCRFALRSTDQQGWVSEKAPQHKAARAINWNSLVSQVQHPFG